MLNIFNILTEVICLETNFRKSTMAVLIRFNNIDLDEAAIGLPVIRASEISLATTFGMATKEGELSTARRLDGSKVGDLGRKEHHRIQLWDACQVR
jgi:hypothetical protein